jgi:hypothetical protein
MNELKEIEAIGLIIETFINEQRLSLIDIDSFMLLDIVKDEYESEMDKMGISLENDFIVHPYEVFNEAMSKILLFTEQFN